jgi:hypothetical protein
MTQIEIRSRPGVFITLDDKVAERIGHWGWCLNKSGYVQAHLPGSKPYKLVRLNRAVIWVSTGKWPERGMEVDHIHHDKLDNRMEKLSVVPPSINMRNQLKHEGASSKYHGVSRVKAQKRWVARVSMWKEGKLHQIYSRITTDEDLAARCADCMRDLVGGFISRNFSEESFEDKWNAIGEEQHKQILHSLEKNGVSYDLVR